MLPILFILCLSTLTTSTSTNKIIPKTTSKYQNLLSAKDCGLRCWLSQIILDIPNKNITEIIPVFGDLLLMVTDFVCKDVVIGGLNSSFVPPLSVYLLANGLGISCQGRWAYEISYNATAPPYLRDNGTFYFNVQNSTMSFTMALYKDSNNLASSANITQCTSKLDVEHVHFEGGKSGPILQYFNTTIKELAQIQIGFVACKEIKTLVNTNLTAALVAIGEEILPFLRPIPPNPPPYVPPGMIVLAKYPLITLIRYIMDEVVGADGVLGLNIIANYFTNNGSYSITIPPYYDDFVTLRIPIPTVGNVTFILVSVGASGLNTWSAFDILEPVPYQNYSLQSYTMLDRLDLDITFSVKVELDGVNADDPLKENGRLKINLTKNALNATAQLAINETKLRYLLEDPMEVYGNPYYLVATLYDLNLTQLLFKMNVDNLAITALVGDIEQEFDTAIDNLLLLFTTGFGMDIPAFWNGYIAGPIRTYANNFFASMIYQSHWLYIPPPTPVPVDWGFDQFGTIISGSACAGILVITWWILFISRNCCWAKEDPSDEIVPIISGKKDQRLCTCLGTHDEVPWIARYGMPLAIIGNIALFLSSNLGVGASVSMIVTLGDDKYTMPSLFSFSLSNSIRDMWNAGVYPLSILIAVFSGGWPYLKLVLLLFCWILPSRVLSSKRREKVLMALDALGKWSLIDAYVLTLMMVAFRIGIIPPVPARMDVIVEPEWGFYSFLLATMLSLVVTHLMLAFHRNAVTNVNRDEDGRIRDIYEITAFPKHEDKPKPLYQHAFPSRFSSVGPALIVILLIASLALIGAGSYYDSFQFQFKGAAALVLKYLNETTDQSYSVVSLGLSLPNSSSNPNGFGIRTIQATFFLFALGMPALHLFLLLVLWISPLSVSVQKKLYVTTEVFNAWSALDVFVIAVIFALLEIEQFAQFIIGDRCDFINQLLRLYLDPALHGDDKCFDVNAQLSMGCWLLFGACVAYLISGNVVMRACHRALRRADKEEGRRTSLN